MATKATSRRKLTEEELNAPDLDEGVRDVELYPIPDGEEISDPYLKKVWDRAVQMLANRSAQKK